MDYGEPQGTKLWKYQWDLIHNPESILFAWTQGEEEGAYSWTPVDKQHALLFNHVYDNNHIGSMKYQKAIEDAIAKGNDDTLSLAYTEDEAGKWTKEQKQWIDGWKIRAMNSDEVFTDIIKSIKETGKDKKIEKIVLRPKHIYIGKYTYEGVDYPVAIYGSGKQTVMTEAFTKIQVTDSKELEDKEKKEHIYCDETYTKYLIIAFYEDEKDDPSMIMQVEKFDFSRDQNTKDMWLKYLGILREAIDGKSIEEIFEDYDILTPAEINQVREQIEQLEDGEKKEEHYLTLQEKVPYHNQRNNDQTQYVSDRMCNLTSEAACFEYLGISCPDGDMQFEDYLEQVREDNNYGARTTQNAREKVAEHIGACYDKKSYGGTFSEEKDKLKDFALPKLKEGSAVMVSVWPGCKGHLVRLQSITDDGLIVDDPYGKVTDFDTREACNSGGYDANSKTEENSKGNDNLWKWDDIKNVTIKYVEIYSKCE